MHTYPGARKYLYRSAYLGWLSLTRLFVWLYHALIVLRSLHPEVINQFRHDAVATHGWLK